MRTSRILAGLILASALGAPRESAGATNPDLSALGQVRAGITDDPAAPDPDEPTLSLGEAEFIVAAPLNPYFKGNFTLAAGEEGVGLEEAYAEVLRGLRFGLGVKAGLYRLGFGRLNAVHPHAYPFLDVPRNWSTLLPGGEEGFADVAVQVSMLLPTPGNWASTLSADVLRGAAFHPDEEATRLGYLGRWSHAFLFAERAALEVGASGATGLDAVSPEARGWLAGGDMKLKLWFAGGASLALQAEGAFRRLHDRDTATSDIIRLGRLGAYAFADLRFNPRWNLGALYDQAGGTADGDPTDRSVKAFAGYAILEETTLIRLAYELSLPGEGETAQTVALQFLFSMGPHKPHQF